MDRWGWKARKANPITVTCGNCKKKFTTATVPGKAKYCSARCRVQASRKNKPKPDLKLKCALCGRSFVAKQRNALYCSQRCRKRASIEARKKLGR